MTPRIQAFARAILAHTLAPDDVPVYDRPLVQECLLVWWLERSIGYRVSDTRTIRTR